MKKHIFFLIAVACILCGCSNLRRTLVVERSVHDTLYVNALHYDSIFIDNWRQIDRSSDTVTIREVLRENRYKLLRDTIRVVRVDSIPVIHEVEVVRTEKYIPKVYKATFWICIILFCVFCVFCVIKIKF